MSVSKKSTARIIEESITKNEIIYKTMIAKINSEQNRVQVNNNQNDLGRDD